MKSRPFVPGQCWLSFARTLALTAVVAALLVWVNHDYLFLAKLYETGDPAANSLSVLRAAHGHEIHGAYSRWYFHHPGPAMFYAFALGEGIAFRWLHLTPTPFNAQVLTVIVLLASFFAASLSVSARWVRSWLFLPLAWMFAALHFTAVDGRMYWVSVWPAYMMPLIFLALVVAAASVGAGQGDDLPLLVLAGCFLLHLQVAQPLFVAPMFVIAYAGLAWACWRRKSAPTDPTLPMAATARPWRIYRKAHGLAFVIAAAFALPLLVDLAAAKSSNFSEILGHLHTHPAVARSWENCVQYFLYFGVYKPSVPDVYTYEGNASWLDVRRYALAHPKMAGLWLGALLTPALALAVRIVRRRPAAVPLQALHPVAGRWRFLGWLTFCWAVSVALTMYWAHIQDGEMFYYNAWFNYSIYYLLALIAAGALADTLETVTRRTAQPFAWRTLVVLVCLAVCGVNLAGHPARYRADSSNDDESRAQANTVQTTLADEPRDKHQARILLFPHDAWGVATGIAAMLERENVKVYVPPDWKFMFGREHVVEKWDGFLKTRKSGAESCLIWHIVPGRTSAEAARRPLFQEYALAPGGLELDPSADATISFVGHDCNSNNFVLRGWETPAPGDTFALSEAPAAWLQFHAHPVPDDAVVEMTLDADPWTIGGVIAPQRVVAHLNDRELGTFVFRPNGDSTNQLRIPAAVWNHNPDAFVILDFLDGKVPPEVQTLPGQATRAIATRQITFRLASSPAVETPPATPTSSVPPVPPTPPMPPTDTSIAAPSPVPSPTPEQEPGLAPPTSMPVEPPSTSQSPEPSPMVPSPAPTPAEVAPTPGESSPSV